MGVSKLCGIYCIENLVNHKVYIGQSINIKRRLSQHIKKLNENKHFNEHLQRAWDKYGEVNFAFSIVITCDVNDLDEFERYYISLCRSCDPDYGYN